MSLDRGELPTGTSSSSSSSSGRTRSASKSQAYVSSSAYAPSTIMRETTTETSIRVLVWHPNAPSSSSSALSNAALFREVPQVRKKLGKNKDRDSLGPGLIDMINNANSITGPADPKLIGSLKNATPSWLREKPSKTKLGGGTTITVQKPQGQWKRGTLTFRETGVLLIYGEDSAMLHSLSATGFSANDIRLVDDSLFMRPHVLGIFAYPSTLFAGGLREQAKASSKFGKSNTSSTGKAKPDPIYICFPNSRKLYMWRGLLRIFARPEIFGPQNDPHRKQTHRGYRHIEMSIHEVKIIAERTTTQERGRRVSGMTSPPPPEIEEPSSITATTIANSSSHGHEIASNADHSLSHLKRSSVDSPIRSVNSALGRSTTIEAGDKQEESIEDSKSRSSISTEEVGEGISGPIINPALARALDNSAVLQHLAPDMERRGSDGSSQNNHAAYNQPQLLPCSCFCQVWMNGEVIARTKMESGTANIAWFDKFALQDLPKLEMLYIEILQSWRAGRYVQLGTVDLPVETMRRGEKIEGWFPIWSPPKTEEAWSKRDENALSYGREVMGELKISINLFDETILASHNYANIDKTLNGPGCVALMRRLCKELEEDKVISYLVDVFTCGGTIVDRLTDLINAESSTFTGEQSLLFRGNTLLSRAIDKYQRRYCIDWLEACVGDTVRRVCADRIRIETNESNIHASPSLSTSAGSMAYHADSNVSTLKALSEDLWQSIYSNRHNCPPDLRRSLASIRQTVNSHFRQSPGSGGQGVGAFVFLRLICPAITSPNLYGLMGSAPDPQSAKTLMLLAKVFLALANKRASFDKDKEPWLTRLNDFLAQHASAYDDFITIVSTEAETSSKAEPLGDEKDHGFQKLLKVRTDGLDTLHRESIPRLGLKLDHTQAMAMLVSYIVREASADDYEDYSQDNTNSSFNSTGLMSPLMSSGMVSGLHHQQHSSDQSEAKMEKLNDFIDLCCDLEDQVGYHIDRAGPNPESMSVATHDGLSGAHRTTSIFTVPKGSPSVAQTSPVIGRSGSRSNVASPTVPQQPSMQRSESVNSGRFRRATVSEGKGNSGKNEMPQWSYIGKDSFLHSIGVTQDSQRGNEPPRQQSHQQMLHSMDEEAETEFQQDDQTGKRHAYTSDANYTASSSASPSGGYGTSAYENLRRLSTDLQQYRRRSADYDNRIRSKQAFSNANEIIYPTGRNDGKDDEAENTKKKRGWWRRKK